jgi:heme oxygenase
MENSETLHQALKKQTTGLHEKGHQVPYIANLLKSTISVESYVGHLRAFAIIYGTLEHQLLELKQPAINDFLEDYTPKLPLILADLEFFNAYNIKDIIPAVNAALSVADKILIYSIRNPYKLLGFLYTLDGSLNGGSVFKKHLAEVFELQNNNGIGYFSSFNEQFKVFWKRFTEKLNTKIVDNQAKEDVLSGALEVFNDIISIYENLYPIDEKHLGNHITALNPEAGNFPIPTNPLEIQAAITAGKKCWNEFSFYEKRYGERGKRFTTSDSVWLVTLSELSIVLANSQVKWLANYLANRGMPVITMELQLKCLFEELVKLIPDKEMKYKILLLVSEQLKNERIEKIPLAIFEKSNSIFEEFCLKLNVKDEPMKNTGQLIASSIADNKNEMQTSLQNFKTWMTNPELFSSNWIQAVEKTYAAIENQI